VGILAGAYTGVAVRFIGVSEPLAYTSFWSALS